MNDLMKTMSNLIKESYEEQIVKQFWKLVDVRDELQEINDSSEEFIESNNQVHNYYVKHLSVLKGKV